MRVVIELVMLFAALLTDVLLGNYGFSPCLSMFVLFHSSRCVSLRFATVGALVLGTLIDLCYNRAAAGTAFWYVFALYAGQAALFSCQVGQWKGKVTAVVGDRYPPGPLEE